MIRRGLRVGRFDIGRFIVELLSGGEMVARALEDEGVEYIFGYPGGTVLHIYDALFKDCKVPHVLVRHEQAATHAADGYARATGKAGVVLGHLGSGCHQCHYRHCHRLYGFHSHGGLSPARCRAT